MIDALSVILQTFKGFFDFMDEVTLIEGVSLLDFFLALAIMIAVAMIVGFFRGGDD